MSFLPFSIQNLITELSKLPGIGPKTAQRLTLYLLRTSERQSRDLGQALIKFRQGIVFCEQCWNLSETTRCAICNDVHREQSLICIVEEILDVIALEKTHEYQGVYHVLHGVLSPINGVGPNQLKIKELISRLQKTVTPVQEIILATNPSLEGEATAAYISNLLKPFSIKVTRLARGLPMGGDLDYADEVTLKNALEGRREYK